MKKLRFKIVSFLLAIILFSSGCATIQRAKRAEELEKEVARLNEEILLLRQERGALEAELKSRDRSLEDLKKRIRDLEKEIKRETEVPKEKQPPLK